MGQRRHRLTFYPKNARFTVFPHIFPIQIQILIRGKIEKCWSLVELLFAFKGKFFWRFSLILASYRLFVIVKLKGRNRFGRGKLLTKLEGWQTDDSACWWRILKVYIWRWGKLQGETKRTVTIFCHQFLKLSLFAWLKLHTRIVHSEVSSDSLVYKLTFIRLARISRDNFLLLLCGFVTSCHTRLKHLIIQIMNIFWHQTASAALLLSQSQIGIFCDSKLLLLVTRWRHRNGWKHYALWLLLHKLRIFEASCSRLSTIHFSILVLFRRTEMVWGHIMGELLFGAGYVRDWLQRKGSLIESLVCKVVGRSLVATRVRFRIRREISVARLVQIWLNLHTFRQKVLCWHLIQRALIEELVEGISHILKLFVIFNVLRLIKGITWGAWALISEQVLAGSLIFQNWEATILYLGIWAINHASIAQTERSFGALPKTETLLLLRTIRKNHVSVRLCLLNCSKVLFQAFFPHVAIKGHQDCITVLLSHFGSSTGQICAVFFSRTYKLRNSIHWVYIEKSNLLSGRISSGSSACRNYLLVKLDGRCVLNLLDVQSLFRRLLDRWCWRLNDTRGCLKAQLLLQLEEFVDARLYSQMRSVGLKKSAPILFSIVLLRMRIVILILIWLLAVCDNTFSIFASSGSLGKFLTSSRNSNLHLLRRIPFFV